jgi:translation initiation factor 3 subunit L
VECGLFIFVSLILAFDLNLRFLNPAGPGLDARIQSYVNYNDFFSLVLADEPLQLELPNIWLWDIIDEFIYQFQSFCLYKANPGKRDKEEVRQFEEQAHDVRFSLLIGKSSFLDLEHLSRFEHVVLVGGQITNQ